MVGNVLNSSVSTQNEGPIGRTDKFHKFQNVKTHSHCFDGIRLTASTTGSTGPCNLDHSINGAIAHRRTVALQGLTDDDEEPGGIEEIVLKFLVNEFRVKNRSEMRSLSSVSFDLRLEGGWIGIRV